VGTREASRAGTGPAADFQVAFANTCHVMSATEWKQRDPDSFSCEAVSVSAGVNVKQAVGLHLAQVIAERASGGIDRTLQSSPGTYRLDVGLFSL